MNPVFVDLETRSAADLRLVGGYGYAHHETTRLLTVAWRTDGQDHVWLPGLHSDPPRVLTDLHLPDVRVYVGERVPAELCRVAHRPFVGHNCWNFDREVWNACTEGFEHVRWVDTYPLALAAGLPGGLDKIGRFLWGEGKYEAGAKELKKGYRATGPADCDPENVPIGRTILIAKYNVQDVRLTEQLYAVVQREARLPESEQRVLAAHDAINDRGCRIDRPLVVALLELAEHSKDHAIEKIAEITNGELKDKADMQSRARVLNWLDAQGFAKFRDTGLRKELVARFIDANRSDEEEGETVEDPDAPQKDAELNACLSRVVNVLELRMSAMRVTGGKLDAALWSMDERNVARGLFAYWGAGPGRWSGRRIQVQNLPRPKEGVDTWSLIRLFEDTGRLEYEAVLSSLPIGERGVDGKLLYPYLSVDDAASGLLRSIFIPADGDVLAAADYAAIECRVLAWMAGEEWLMQSFWDGGDPYLLMAERIFGNRDKWMKFPDPKKPGEFLPVKKHPYRQVGKVVLLGSGYQLGSAKFAVYAASNGIDLSVVDTTPDACITAYRTAHPKIAGEYHGMNEKGRPIFRGGLWYDLNRAVMTAIETGGRTYAGRCTYHMEGSSLICTLPSQRRLVYRGAQIVDAQHRVPWDSEGRPVPAAVYWSPRYGVKHLYGGLIAENCLSANTRVLTERGPVRIVDIRNMDRVWDGVEWVSHAGCSFRGIKETGTWLGVRLTADHLIHDGSKWRKAIHLDDLSSAQCLATGSNSAPWSSWSGEEERGRKVLVAVPAGPRRKSRLGGSFEKLRRAAVRAHIYTIRTMPRTPTCSRTRPSGRCGRIGTAVWSRDVPTRTTGRTRTTAGAALRFMARGSQTDDCSSRTAKHCPAGTTFLSTWTDERTTEITSRETFVSSREKRTQETSGGRFVLPSPVLRTTLRPFASASVLTGFAELSGTTTIGVEPGTGSWRSTGNDEAVYDLINCGPRHRFTILTDAGPVLVHNCVQATARDILAAAMVRLEEHGGMPVCLHCHDEAVSSTRPERYSEFMKRVTTCPDWLTDFPLAAEGGLAPRYAKSPPPGEREQVWRNGSFIKGA